MNLHEFQAKDVLARYGIPTPPYAVLESVETLAEAHAQIGSEGAVVKVQVHAGGRGKAGGVKIGKNRDEVKRHVEALLGMKIQNTQTGSHGVIAHQVLMTRPVDYVQEYYLGAIIDRKAAVGLLIASTEGGMEIEEVAARTPEKIWRLPIPLNGQFYRFELVELAQKMGWKGPLIDQGVKILNGLARAFVELDASLLEINPLVLTKEGQLTALDAKISIDENALYRHKDLAALEDIRQLPDSEAKARQFDLAYIALEGNIGCMVNGAGLAMATMDLIRSAGGTPANFLDVGGGATTEKVAEGFKILLSDPQVKAILVNIFGGIMNCETLAEGIIQAAREVQLAVPLVVRMEGTNVEKGRALLMHSGLPIIVAYDLTTAAQEAVKYAHSC